MDVSTMEIKDAAKWKLQETPVTVVIDKNGVVEKVWVGNWNESAKDSVQEYFGVKL